MTRWIKVYRDLWINRSRTMLIILSIAVGVFAIGLIGMSQFALLESLDAQYAAMHPADAILLTEPGLDERLEVNTEYAKGWPNITQKKESPADAKDFEGMEGKFEKYFSKAPGTGD